MGKNINGDRPTAFPLEQEKLPFTIPVVEEPRPKIAKLVAMITDRVPAKLKGVKGNDPEYWGLADLVSDEMADVALKMGVRKPKTIQQLMKLTKLEREPLQKLLDQMAWVGLIEYNWENLDGKNPNHEKRYVLPQFVPGSAEFFNMRRSQMDEHPQVAAFFERMTFLPLEKITPMVPPGGAGIGMHVIPVEKAIETENEAVGLEKISYWLHKYEGKYAKSMCSCRASRQYLGEGCGDDPESWCIAVGDMATYIVETGRASTSPMTRPWPSSRRPRTTASSTRSPTSTARTRSLPCATATSTSATPCAPASCSTLPICPAAPMWPGWRRTSAWPAAGAWNTVPPVR